MPEAALEIRYSLFICAILTEPPNRPAARTLPMNAPAPEGTTPPTPSPHPRRDLLPKGWASAPWTFYKRQRGAAITFFLANFFVGALGIWLPLANYILTDGKAGSSFFDLLSAGGPYLFAIPFLGATVGIVLAGLQKDTDESTRATKIFLLQMAGVAVVICLLLMQLQLLTVKSNPPLVTLNALQLLVVVVTISVGIYMHALVENERLGSPAEDINEGAKQMQAKANTAVPNPEDF